MEALKPTQCNLQLIRVIFLLRKTEKSVCNTKRKQTKAWFHLLLPITPTLRTLTASLDIIFFFLFTKERMTEMKGHGSGS